MLRQPPSVSQDDILPKVVSFCKKHGVFQKFADSIHEILKTGPTCCDSLSKTFAHAWHLNSYPGTQDNTAWFHEMLNALVSWDGTKDFDDLSTFTNLIRFIAYLVYFYTNGTCNPALDCFTAEPDRVDIRSLRLPLDKMPGTFELADFDKPLSLPVKSEKKEEEKKLSTTILKALLPVGMPVLVLGEEHTICIVRTNEMICNFYDPSLSHPVSKFPLRLLSKEIFKANGVLGQRATMGFVAYGSSSVFPSPTTLLPLLEVDKICNSPSLYYAKNNTELHLAAELNCISSIQYYLSRGYKILQNSYGAYPSKLALHFGHKEAAEILAPYEEKEIHRQAKARDESKLASLTQTMGVFPAPVTHSTSSSSSSTVVYRVIRHKVTTSSSSLHVEPGKRKPDDDFESQGNTKKGPGV